jgi:citronellol/citronellal dehydrogenase
LQYASVYAPGQFSGRTFIVTGGGSGLGRCNAHELASLGAHVEIIGRRIEPLRQVVAEIEEDGGSVGYTSLDIRDESAVGEKVADLLEKNGRIHGLVNNAGGQYPAKLESISAKGFEAVVRTNLIGGFLLSRELFKQHFREHGGVIVNILADMWQGMPGMGHSGASRAGMENFTKTAAFEWGPYGVRVNAVAPGYIASSGFDTYPPELREWLRSLPGYVPLRRVGTESEISAAITFLLTDAAAFINGVTIPVDGGAPLVRAGPLLNHPETGQSRPFNGFHRSIKPKVLD